MKRWLVYCERHRWAYIVSFPVLLPYAVYLLFKALREWHN